jgi:hypothetical protein
MTRGRFLGAVAVVALVLGVIGYRDVSGHHYSNSDAFYWSISMFSGRLGTIPHATPLTLNIGRFLALAVSASVAVTGVILLLRVRWDRWVTERFASGHTLIVGSSPAAASAGEALCGAGERVTLVDADPRSAGVAPSAVRLVPIGVEALVLELVERPVGVAA